VEIAVHQVLDLDIQGNLLRVVKYTDYTADKVRTLVRDANELRDRWVDPAGRNEIIEALAERGIDFVQLAEAAPARDGRTVTVAEVLHKAEQRLERGRMASAAAAKKCPRLFQCCA